MKYLLLALLMCCALLVACSAGETNEDDEVLVVDENLVDLDEPTDMGNPDTQNDLEEAEPEPEPVQEEAVQVETKPADEYKKVSTSTELYIRVS